VKCAAENGRVGGLRVRGNWRWLRAREESAPQDFPPRAGHLQGPIQNERGNREGKRGRMSSGADSDRERKQREIERGRRSSRARFRSREETEMERERAQAAGTWNPRRRRSAHPAASVPCSSPAAPALFTLAFLCS